MPRLGTSGAGGRRGVAVQKFGTFLSGMIMPNIAAFIAWGFITAFFIETGWFPVEGLAASARTTPGYYPWPCRADDQFMLPLLIANTGGRMVYGVGVGWSRWWPPWA